MAGHEVVAGEDYDAADGETGRAEIDAEDGASEGAQEIPLSDIGRDTVPAYGVDGGACEGEGSKPDASGTESGFRRAAAEDFQCQLAERDAEIARLRVQVAPEADAFTYAQIAGHAGVKKEPVDFGAAEAGDILAALRDVTSEMDELQVSAGSHLLFITPTLKGVLDDFSLAANPTRSNHVLTRFSRIVEVLQVRFYDKISLLSGDGDQFGYEKAAGASDINFMVVEKSAVIKYDKHVASRIFSPNELDTLDSYMINYH